MPDQDDLPLLISLSSGTTGKHKGSLVTHGQMYQRFVGQWVTIGFNSQDRFLGLIPLFFSAALYPAEAGEMRRKVNPGLTGYYTSNEGGGRRRRAIGKIRRDRDGVYHGRRNYHRKRPGCSLPETTGALQGTVPLRGGRGITENVLGETG